MAGWKTVKGRKCKATRFPGVAILEDGRYWIRARAKSPKTGLLVEVNRVLETQTASLASDVLQDALRGIRLGQAAPGKPMQRFASYAAQLFKAKVDAGEINGAASRRRWEQELVNHLIPAWGDWYIDQIKAVDVQAWRAKLAERAAAKKADQAAKRYAPATINGWLSTFSTIIKAAQAEYELEHDALRGLRPLDASTWRSYTREQPNSLTDPEVRRFLDAVWDLYPQHYAMFATGFTFGLRPSSLRPLRRRGPEADVVWAEQLLLIRRSHTRSKEIGDFTKNKRDQELGITEPLLGLYRWHIETQLETPEQKASDLLFPCPDGGPWAETTINYIFDRVNDALAAKGEWPKRITPRAMRRTFYNLVDQLKVAEALQRSISGHATARMADRYRSDQAAAQRVVVGQIIDLAGVRAQKSAAGGASGGAGEPASDETPKQRPRV